MAQLKFPLYALLVLFIVVAPRPCHANDEDMARAKRAVRMQDYDGAASIYQKLANQGNAEAQYQFGVFLKTGKGVKKNHSKALIWFKEAAAQGHKKAISKVEAWKTQNRTVRLNNTISKDDLLLIAASRGNLAEFKKLLRDGAKINAKSIGGRTALMEAVQGHHIGVLKVLINKGAMLDLANNKGDTALLIAADLGNVEAFELLSKADSNINVRNKYGYTPLMIAAQRDYPEIAKFLIDQGVDFSGTNQTGQDAYLIAQAKGHDDIAEMLLASGKIKIEDEKQEVVTVVPESIPEPEQPAPLESLFLKDADMVAIDDAGRTPLMHAAERGEQDIILYLVEHDVEIDAQDENGDTALSFAIRKGHSDIARRLIEKGANPYYPLKVVDNIEPSMKDILKEHWSLSGWIKEIFWI